MNMMAWPHRRAWAPGIAAVTALVVASATPAPAHAAPGWQVTDAAEAGSGISAYHGLTLDGAGNVWAGGAADRGLQIDTLEPHVEQLLHRWDGVTWTAAPQPERTQNAGSFRPQALASAGDDIWVVGTTIQRYRDGQWTLYPHDSTSPLTQLQAVAAVSATNVWAVGRQTTGALIERWDGTRWTQFPVANVGSGNLMAIEVLSPNDIWAVGRNGSASLTMHWDGRFWSVVPSPNVSGATYTELRGVDAVAPDDIWAVGTAGGGKTVAMHWDGRLWTIVPSPSPAKHQNQLNSVSVVSANDVWAVGYTNRKILTAHWDGVAWKHIEGPLTSQRNEELYQVVARSATDVLAVGRSEQAALVTRWDGSQWRIVRSARAGYGNVVLSDVAGAASDAVWAAGTFRDGALRRPLVQRWDGARWRNESLPLPIDSGTPNGEPMDAVELHGVAVRTRDDAWAVGEAGLISGVSGTDILLPQTLVYHWDGAAWAILPSPSPRGKSVTHRLNSVVALGPDNVWAVGEYGRPGQGSDPLALRWDGSRWHEVPVPPGPNLFNELKDVVATGDGGLWAVGSSGDVFAGTVPIARRWDGSSWAEVAVPVPGTGSGRLESVAVASADQAWAVGSDGRRSMVMRWDGVRWSVDFQRDIGSGLEAVVVSGSGVWAVGSGTNSVCLRWAAGAWTQVAVPRPAVYDRLFGVTALPSGEVWAVGQANRGDLSVYRAFAIRMPGS